jgi:hypothetical protein
MANQNEKIILNEDGKIVVNDPQLAKALQELSPEELDGVAGGSINIFKCKVKE